MEPFVLSKASATAISTDSTTETVGLAVRNSDGYLQAEIYVRDGAESLLAIYTITGQIRFKKRFLSSGYQELLINLKRGNYVATLVSGKSWVAKIVTIK